ncbi:ester cyclase [Ferruginibacter sp. SUN106]|uniref:ester cyclase n=1 Tax=Ferruginibacter sp. SUN106 TaxID=2978348 RepID=UPI003D366265
MEQLKQNKEFIVRYFKALSGVAKTTDLVKQYVTDEGLIEHIAFFDKAFPQYELVADEMTAEGNRVVVKARFKGVHQGEFNGILPTHRTAEFPFVVSYDIENGKIVHHWLIADSMIMMEQLGVMNVPA